MNARLAMLIGALALLPIAPPAADADETGMVGLHSLRREGGKTCMSEHEHHGSSSGHASRRAAEAAAGYDWQGFTAWEYGTSWGSFAAAAGKKMSCSHGAGGWSCEVDARPCRR